MPKYKTEKQMLAQERLILVKQLRNRGYTHEEIAWIMNRSRFWVIKQLSTKEKLTK